ncbi:MAG TPA: polyphosphate kinase 2 family protein [Phycisphaerales bacterium]|nr:polyphosphate kinase 2 family protein [Phycisphaerales bacterium]
MNLRRITVEPGSKVKLKDHDPAASEGVRDRDEAEEKLAANVKRLAELQYRLWAERKRSLLLILQGMDTSGKDGVVRHVMTGINPSGCRVTSFKKPSEEETERDFLWRIHKAVPARGEIGVFNRSHYEDVLIVRVHHLVEPGVWKLRYEQINAFERMLAGAGTTIVKCFLHISRAEQKKRLLARLEDPAKNWKFNAGDVEERKHWKGYVSAYEDALGKCSTPHAPWHIIPADRKWYRDWLVSELLVETMEAMNPRTPEGTMKKSDFFIAD